MSFAQVFDPVATRDAADRARYATRADVREAVQSGDRAWERFPVLLSPAAGEMLEMLAQRAHELTVERFGQTMALFAPLYLSNACVCTCTYCGFSMGLPIRRKTLPIDEVAAEARVLASRGFRNLLLVSSEHPKHVNAAYLAQCVSEVKKIVPYVALEVAAAQTPEYATWAHAGCDGIVLYQETYDPDAYPRYHVGGPKRDYHSRLDAPERAAAGGIRHLGLGALFGLSDWRFEALALLDHARHLYRHGWRSQINISLPRINAAAGGFVPQHPVTDAELVQLIVALRIALPAAGIVLSTRERASLRDSLAPLGITHMSAGSSTEPGGYSTPGDAGEQFHLEDTRPPDEVARRLLELGYEAVFKDWEPDLGGREAHAIGA
ncbi:MAG TPA: 2-iminoacetate synthase ThiH [Candidatus Acidoferrales bacterium]|nr:2-iminoacetate synthase ThiH [Candidatus Acidoferrales bacterium]